MNSNLTKVDLYKAVLSDTKEIIGKSADKDLKKELFRLEKDLFTQIDLYKNAFANSNSKLFFSEFMINFLDKMENCLISFQEVPGIILAVDENDIYSSYAFLWGILYHCHISKIEDIKTFKYDNMAKFSEFLNKLGIVVKIKENYEKYVIGIINGEISLSKAKNFLSELLENGVLTTIKKKKKYRSKKNKTKKVKEKKEEELKEEEKKEDELKEEEKKEDELKEMTKEPNEEKKEDDKDEDQKEEDIEEDETKKKIKEYGEINEERGTENPEEKIEEEIKEETKEKENENEEDKESIKGKDDNSKETIKEGEDVFEEEEKEEKEEKEREDNNNINDNEKGNNNDLVNPQEETITHDQLVLIVKSLQAKLFQHELRIKNLEENQKLLFYQLSMYQARDISKNIYYYFCKYLKNSNGEKPFSDLLTIMDYFNKGGDGKYTPEQQKILRKFFRVIFFINKANNRILHNNLSSAVKEAIEKKKENDLLSLLPPNNYAQLFETLKNYLDLNLKNEQFQEALRYVYENAYIHDDKIEIIRVNDSEAIKKEIDSIKFLITKDEIDEAKKLFDVIKIGNETFEQVCNAKTYESSE